MSSICFFASANLASTSALVGGAWLMPAGVNLSVIALIASPGGKCAKSGKDLPRPSLIFFFASSNFSVMGVAPAGASPNTAPDNMASKSGMLGLPPSDRLARIASRAASVSDVPSAGKMAAGSSSTERSGNSMSLKAFTAGWRLTSRRNRASRSNQTLSRSGAGLDRAVVIFSRASARISSGASSGRARASSASTSRAARISAAASSISGGASVSGASRFSAAANKWSKPSTPSSAAGPPLRTASALLSKSANCLSANSQISPRSISSSSISSSVTMGNSGNSGGGDRGKAPGCNPAWRSICFRITSCARVDFAMISARLRLRAASRRAISSFVRSGLSGLSRNK